MWVNLARCDKAEHCPANFVENRKTIGTSAMQSRACAVLANGKYIFALPGSSGGVADAWDGILKYQLDINHKPCNFVELFPRLKEK